MGSLFLSSEEAADLHELVKQNKELQEKLKEQAGDGDGDGWTKEKIMAVKDQRKRQALIKGHMHLFRG